MTAPDWRLAPVRRPTGLPAKAAKAEDMRLPRLASLALCSSIRLDPAAERRICPSDRRRRAHRRSGRRHRTYRDGRSPSPWRAACPGSRTGSLIASLFCHSPIRSDSTPLAPSTKYSGIDILGRIIELRQRQKNAADRRRLPEIDALRCCCAVTASCPPSLTALSRPAPLPRHHCDHDMPR